MRCHPDAKRSEEEKSAVAPQHRLRGLMRFPALPDKSTAKLARSSCKFACFSAIPCRIAGETDKT
jgi:hypothetical protein